MKKTVAFILPYIGKFNNYFNLFLQSCSFNPDIDWFIFTDNDAKSIYPNIYFIKITFEDLKKRIQKQYDFEILLDNPYDLCDFKVAYGEIFQDYIREYDFWGFCDCDLIFGNLRHFVTDDILDTYDKIYLRGHCTLFRNNAEINSLYRRSINGNERYKYCFTHAGAHHFDEGPADCVEGINMIFTQAQKKIYDRHDFMDVNIYHYGFFQTDFINEPEEIAISRNSFFYWERGRLVRSYQSNAGVIEKEFMYIHLQKRKMNVTFSCNDSLKLPQKYIIVPNKFEKFDQSKEKSYLSMNRDRIYWGYLAKRVKTKIRRIVNKQ